jgi:hypothetical protein
MKFPTYAFTAQGDRDHQKSSFRKDAREGYYITVPDFKPPTQIFIRHGEDPKKVIEKFKSKRQP